MQATIDEEAVLALLMQPPSTNDTEPGRDGCVAVAKLRDLPQRDVKHYLQTLYEASLSSQCSKLKTIADQLQHISRMVRLRMFHRAPSNGRQVSDLQFLPRRGTLSAAAGNAAHCAALSKAAERAHTLMGARRRCTYPRKRSKSTRAMRRNTSGAR